MPLKLIKLRNLLKEKNKLFLRYVWRTGNKKWATEFFVTYKVLWYITRFIGLIFAEANISFFQK